MALPVEAIRPPTQVASCQDGRLTVLALATSRRNRRGGAWCGRDEPGGFDDAGPRVMLL